MAQAKPLNDFSEERRKLLQQRTELLDRLQRIDWDRRRVSNPLERDPEEHLAVVENDEVLDGLEEQARLELAEINRALQRIDEGTYGVCASCSQAIEPARLAALPYTTTCAPCAGRSEKRKTPTLPVGDTAERMPTTPR